MNGTNCTNDGAALNRRGPVGELVPKRPRTVQVPVGMAKAGIGVSAYRRNEVEAGGGVLECRGS